MPPSAWHSCRDAALFPNYFGQTCYYSVVFMLQRTLIITSDMMLIGVIDSELVSRVGEFSLTLLQHGNNKLSYHRDSM